MSIVVKKNFLEDLILKVKNGDLTIDQYHNILMSHTMDRMNKEKEKKDADEKEKVEKKIKHRTIDEINSEAKGRKKQIRKWKHENKGTTELERINQDPELVQGKIDALLAKGAKEITKPKFEDIEKMKNELGGRLLISYILLDGTYRSGGFLTANSNYYFVILGGQTTNRISFSVQYANVKAVYVRKVNKRSDNKPIKPVATQHDKTRFPVKVGNIVVYYAKDNFDRTRFKNTHKYANMLKYEKKNLA